MSVIDAADGILMLGVYDWVFVTPIRKLYYNLTITFVSVAVLIGGIETLGLLGDRFAVKGAFWDRIGGLNDNFTTLGLSSSGCLSRAGPARQSSTATRDSTKSK
jgi:nickel/cobalt transporter (NiCoT) family protein